MTTIHEDQSSWRYGGIRVRDARHTHDGPEVPRYRTAKKRKTCRGKNNPHNFTTLIRDYSRWGMNARVMACGVCGKHKWFDERKIDG